MWFAGASAGGLAQDATYRKDIKPLFDAKCAGCHGAASPVLQEFLLDEKKFAAAMKGPRMDSYADMLQLVGWPDTGAIMRRLDDGKNAGGKPGNMYQYLGASDEERQKNLRTFKAWVGPEGWALNRFKARGKVPGVTKEQLEKIKVKY
ncbi:MAG: cytochrome C [Betaproteobacteria bacterium]|nr:cytochrome C [Betaproteobacteria bacterium]